MKQCPTCQKTFEDGMKFCQTDGTPLIQLMEEAPEDTPFKTVVAGSGTPLAKEDDLLQLPEEPEPLDPMKTVLVSDIKKEIPNYEAPISQPLDPPKFSEPSLNPPSFGDLSEPPPSEAPTVLSPDFPDATFSSMPLPSDSPFSLSNEESSSPFQQPASNPFDMQPPKFEPPPFPESEPPKIEAPKFEPPPFKEPEPLSAQANDPFGSSPFDQQSPFGQDQMMQQPPAWTPPPAPDANWGNQGLGQNTPFQPPPIGAGQNQTLPIVSLVFGILSVCCYISLLTGPIALITGFLGMRNANQNPAEYGGKSMAIAGMIIGGIMFALMALYILFILVLGVGGQFL